MKILITLHMNAQEVVCETVNNPDLSVTVTCRPVEKAEQPYPLYQSADYYRILESLIKESTTTEESDSRQ